MNNREKLQDLHERLMDIEREYKFDEDGGLFDIRVKVIRHARFNCETILIALEDAEYERENK